MALTEPEVAEQEARSSRRMVPKPEAAQRFEAWLGRNIPIHPNILSSIKLVVVTPLIFLALRQIDVLRFDYAYVIGLFGLFAALDFLDGVIARQRGLESSFGRILDRITDYPLLLVVSWYSLDVLPTALVVTKLVIDLGLLVLYLLGRGSTENRLRTALSYSTVLVLLLVSQGWVPEVVTPVVVEYFLWASIAFSSTVLLYNLDVLQKRFIADALSGANLLCGVFSMVFASRGQIEISLLFLVMGAAFDGFDGAAARRWGGTRWGVYSDDVADGVNYGIAPGVALAFYFGTTTLEGLGIGIFYAVFTIGRLVFFTLNKKMDDADDPNFFKGVPSTVGGLIVLSSLIVFDGHPAVVGTLVGIACTLMVSFASLYHHLGRAVAARKKRVVFGAPVYLIILIAGFALWGKVGAAALVLGANLFYGFLPTLLAFRDLLRPRVAP